MYKTLHMKSEYYSTSKQLQRFIIRYFDRCYLYYKAIKRSLCNKIHFKLMLKLKQIIQVAMKQLLGIVLFE
jgi:hypothetical protein